MGLVVLRRPLELGRAGDGVVDAGNEKLALGDQQHAFPVGLHDMARRRLEPTETAAVQNRRLGGIAEVVEVAGVELGQALDVGSWFELAGFGHQGLHFRKFASRCSPAFWLFSGWNWVPTRLSRPTIAVIGPP